MWEVWVPGSLSLAIVALLAWLPNRNNKAVEASTDALEGVVSALHEARTEIQNLKDQNAKQAEQMEAQEQEIGILRRRVVELEGKV